MKRILCLFMVVILSLSLIACEDDEIRYGEVKTPSGSSVLAGRDYNDVVSIFEEAGFTNIKLEPIDDLILGWLTKDGEVEDVSVGGSVDYDADEWVPANTEVIIRYHTFPQKSSETTTNTDVQKPPDSDSSAVTEHIHSLVDATCTSSQSCLTCGEIVGEPLGHDWKDATCSTPKSCNVCGIILGSASNHTYKNGKCTTCGKTDTDYVSEVMVWIPTKGGTKYHSRSNCSNMDDPEKVTKSEAEALGFTACKRCH